ncbi:MAG: CYTH domain-containing protein [Clostridia bacterium]|nr:CYTH domain-containing protein [Clostridia bacterium]
MGKEYEIKFHVDSGEQLQHIFASELIESVRCEPWQTMPMHTRYYDVPARTFAMLKWTFRQRREGERRVVCLKTPSDRKDARQEYEILHEQIDDAAIDALEKIGVPKELRMILKGQELQCVCSAEFTRQVAMIRLPDGTLASLSGDIGVLCGETERTEFCEIETEFVSGSEKAMEAFAAQLARTFDLHIEPKSKFVRAASLK